MRLYWCVVLFSVVTLGSAKQDTQDNSVSSEKLSEHCSEFVENCIQLCQDEKIVSFSSNCSEREATCHCNEKDLSATVFKTLLANAEQPVEQQHMGKKKDLQVETSDNMLSPVQFEAADDNEQGFIQQEDDQSIEYIYPRFEYMKNTLFQQSFCTKFFVRCKQDCPAAFSSYDCNVNQLETGFLLSCMCNGVDIAASVNAQVQAESL